MSLFIFDVVFGFSNHCAYDSARRTGYNTADRSVFYNALHCLAGFQLSFCLFSRRTRHKRTGFQQILWCETHDVTSFDTVIHVRVAAQILHVSSGRYSRLIFRTDFHLAKRDLRR